MASRAIRRIAESEKRLIVCMGATDTGAFLGTLVPKVPNSRVTLGAS